MGWKQATLFTVIGAGAILGAEAIYGVSVISKMQHSSNTAGGYKIGMNETGRTVDYAAPVGIYLMQLGANGQYVPVANAKVNLTIAQQSGTYTGTIITDKLGIGIFEVLAQNAQTVVITASYTPSGGTTVTDVLNVTFAAVGTGS